MTALADIDTLRAELIDHPLHPRIDTVDHDENGPPALKLLAALCAADPDREAEAVRLSIAAIETRIGMWDGVLAEFDAMEESSVH